MKDFLEKEMQDKKAILQPDCTYHIYNRANGDERLFVSDENYLFFMEKYRRYVEPVADTFCYCLMPNHFHFLVRVKGEEEILRVLEEEAPPKTLQGRANLQGFQNLEGFIGQRFSNFFNSYSKDFNKKQGRRGSLFMHTFKRKKITDEKYLLKLVHYIHYNPVESGLVKQPEEWRFSSYAAIISTRNTMLKREELMEWFGDRNNFMHCHRYPPQLTGVEDF